MRISTNTVYQSGISKITSLTVEQSKLQAQISTGKRVVTPSDDPVAAARILDVKHNQDINNSFANVRKTAQTNLETLDSSLSNISDLLVSAQSTLVAAGNGAYSDTERSNIASDLKNSLDALVGMANSKDAYGNYLYAGFKSNAPAFVANASGASYSGDNNIQSLQVDTQRQMEVTVPGSTVFQGGGTDVFATLNNIVNLLKTPITDATTQAAFTSGLATAIDGVKASEDNILNIRASVGSKLNELDSLNNAGQDRDLQYSKTLSDLQDLDYAAAVSDLSKNQTIMDAAQKSFVATTKLSLFNYM
jgi:flagellar hook-associated protein 3 FlgL